MSKITSKEIAKIAGVSVSTVSIVMNNKPGVGDATRERVLKILASHGISPKPLTVPGSRGIVRFCKIVKHGNIINDRHNVFISDYIDGVIEEARILDHTVEISTFENISFSKIVAELNQNSEVKGCILLSTEFDNEDFEIFSSLKIPHVFLDASIPFSQGVFVTMDSTTMVYDALSHLQANGHTKVGMFTASGCSNFIEREKAFREGVRALGLVSDESLIIPVRSTLAAATKDVYSYFKDQKNNIDATAFLACNDIVAIGAIQAFQKLKLVVPDDISIIGFDDLPMSSLLTPALTSLIVPKLSIGRMAVRTLLGDWENANKIISQKHHIGGSLIVRDSVKAL